MYYVREKWAMNYYAPFLLSSLAIYFHNVFNVLCFQFIRNRPDLFTAEDEEEEVADEFWEAFNVPWVGLITVLFFFIALV